MCALTIGCDVSDKIKTFNGICFNDYRVSEFPVVGSEGIGKYWDIILFLGGGLNLTIKVILDS